MSGQMVHDYPYGYVPKSSIIVTVVANGFRASIAGDHSYQEDAMIGEYVFESLEGLQKFISKYYEKYNKE